LKVPGLTQVIQEAGARVEAFNFASVSAFSLRQKRAVASKLSVIGTMGKGQGNVEARCQDEGRSVRDRGRFFERPRLGAIARRFLRR
jgi:hypothetical protein